MNISFSGEEKLLLDDKVTLCQQQLLHHGYCLLESLDQDFDVSQFLENFGSLMPQYDGEYVYSVQFCAEFDNYSDSKSTNGLTPHSDGSDFAMPPRWMALWGMQAASCGGGQTLLADTHEFINLLDADTQEQLRKRKYIFQSSRGIHAQRRQVVESPLLSEVPGINCPIFRFSHNLLLYEDYSAPINQLTITADSFTINLCTQISEFFELHHTAFLVKRRDLLIWDNWRMLHSRKPYSDTARHLQRYWISSNS